MNGASVADGVAASLALLRDRRFADAQDYVRALLASCSPADHPLAEACAAIVAWRARANDGAPLDAGLAEAVAGIARLEQAGCATSLAWVKSSAGFALGLLGNFEAGFEWLDAAIEDAVRRDDSVLVVMISSHKASLLAYAGELDAAFAQFEQALRLCTGDAQAIRAGLLNNLSYCQILRARRLPRDDPKRGELARQALDFADATLASRESPQYASWHAQALDNRGASLFLLGRLAEAEAAFAEGLRGATDGRTTADLMAGTAEIMLADGRHEQARGLLEQAAAKAPANLVSPTADRIFELRIELARRAGRPYDVQALWERRFREVSELYQTRLRNVRRFADLFADLKKAQAEREAANAANRAKSEFLAHMSHEIRTPMNAIVALTQFLAEGPLTADQAETVRTIRDAGDALVQIVDDILDLSKIEAGRLRLEQQPFDLAPVLDRVDKLLRHMAERKGLRLRIEGPPGDPGPLRGDSMRLAQVLVNLVGNAIKFTATGDVDVQVLSLRTGPDSTWLRFEVRDSGIGIDPTVAPGLFAPFVQATAGTTRRFGGTGLGLAISKRLVDGMGGEIGVASTPGAGSTFWFELPFGRTAAS